MSAANILMRREISPLTACMMAKPKQGETGKIISVINS